VPAPISARQIDVQIERICAICTCIYVLMRNNFAEIEEITLSNPKDNIVQSSKSDVKRKLTCYNEIFCAVQILKFCLICPCLQKAITCLVKLHSFYDSKITETVCIRQLDKYDPLSRTYDFAAFPRKNTNRVCSLFSEAKDKDWRRWMKEWSDKWIRTYENRYSLCSSIAKVGNCMVVCTIPPVSGF
jgi:hypothetical protein